ncbi:hypothetical protein [Thioflexithrix psekupsensis]|uniref:Uncharacterized protein n=1 Tax=Thioflexithrix psekupsensis TaxID=1570016 RepID=A0A251X3D3_9GAMM|nr:hypothetical protein [Thioflexithrix psekupsensis]OUD11647.1 hypothetical protein TPSD3_16455 [Thioflexithrix psekupsensis]
MDIFFNELSLTTADTDEQACLWLEKLAQLGRLLKQITESLQDDSFSFRRSDDFAQKMITKNQTLFDFLQDNFDHHDSVYIFLLGIFDSPYITEDDPHRNIYDLTYITLNGVDHHEPTGIAAAYLKDSLVVSLDSVTQWNMCQFGVSITRVSDQGDVTEIKSIRNASNKKHIVDCHLAFLSRLYNWQGYKPYFNPELKRTNLLVLKEIYSLHLDDDMSTVWDTFYKELSKLTVDEKVSRIRQLSTHIAKIQKWEKATGSLEKNNPARIIYTIPNSEFIVSVDTQHGEFEIHKNEKGNNHLGSISFDGKNFKPQISNRSLKL